MASRKGPGAEGGSGGVGKPLGAIKEDGGGGWRIVVYGGETLLLGLPDIVTDGHRDGSCRVLEKEERLSNVERFPVQNKRFQ